MAKDATRRAMITVGLNDRELDRGLAEARRKVRKAGDDVDRTGRRIGGRDRGKGRGGLSMLGGAIGGATAAATGAIGGFFSGTVQDLFDFEKALARLQIASGKSDADMAKLRQSIRDVSKATGIASADILTGTQSYVDLTGDIDGAEAAMSSFARIAQASGSSVSDVASAAAAMKQSFKLEGTDFERVFSGFITQGKAGAVSLKDFAAELAALAPRWAKFNEGTTDMGIAQLGAAFQTARQGFGTASEAATGLQALMGAIVQNAQKFSGAGVKVFDTSMVNGKPTKTLRSFEQIIKSIEKSKLVRDPTLMNKALGSKEAEQTLSMLLRARAEVTKTGNAYTDLVEAGRDAGAVQRDLDTWINSSAGKIEKSLNAAKISLAEAFTPERIEKFANALAKAADWFAKIVGFAEKIGSFLSDDTMSDTGLAGKAAQGILKDTSGKARSREEAKAIVQKMARGEQGGGDTFWAHSPELRKQAAAVAAQRLNLTPTGEEWLAPDQDPWAGRRSANAEPLPGPESAREFMDELGRRLEQAIAKGTAAGMGRAAVQVKADGNAIAKTVANAPRKMQPR